MRVTSRRVIFFFPAHDVELDRIAFTEALITVSLDSAVMAKHVCATLIAQKSVSLGIVEPCHLPRVLCHCFLLELPFDDDGAANMIFGSRQNVSPAFEVIRGRGGVLWFYADSDRMHKTETTVSKAS